MTKFRATHEITHNGTKIPVMHRGGVLFTQTEWDESTTADWELVGGELRFQGNVPAGVSSYRRVWVVRDAGSDLDLDGAVSPNLINVSLSAGPGVGIPARWNGEEWVHTPRGDRHVYAVMSD